MLDFDELEEAEEAAKSAESAAAEAAAIQAAAAKAAAVAEAAAAEAAAAEAAAAKAAKQALAAVDHNDGANGKAAPAKPQVTPPPYGDFVEAHLARLISGQAAATASQPPRAPGAKVDQDFEARRSECEGNRVKLVSQGFKSLPPWKKLTKAELEKVANTTLKGEMYGLPIPPTLAELERLGAPWLTKAFHAAGTLSADNAVKQVLKFTRLPVQGREAAGGAGAKAILTVEYSKPEPEFHTQLFVKMPWSIGETKEMGGDAFYRWKISCNVDNDGQEVTIYRFLGPIFPFRIPKYYFADICRENTNFVLITETIPFGKQGQQTLEPYEVLPVAEKFFDFKLEPRMRYEMYYCIVRAQARLAAWDKMGAFKDVPEEVRGASMAPPPLGSFQFPLPIPAKRRDMLKRTGTVCGKLWKEFVGGVAKKCYPAELTEPAFLDALYDCCVDAVCYKDDIFMYCFLFPDMIALQHSNLQSDNAYYWRNKEGEMDCGIIDWGGAAPGHFCIRFTSSITSAEGDVLDEHEDGLLQCFIDEYYQECGIKLDFEEFRRQWWLCYATYVTSMGTNIEMEIFRETPREAWASIDSLWHDKVAGIWNVRCYAFMIASALKYLHLRWQRGGRKGLHVHETLKSWRAYWEPKGMT